MDETMIIEILKGIGRFFINPLLYIALISAVFLGYRRVKRERRFFHIRILDGWSELRNMLLMGFVLSLIISLFSVVIGLTISLELLVAVFLISLIGLFAFMYHLLSPIILMTLAFCVIVWMDWQDWSYSFWGIDLVARNVVDDLVITVPVLAGLLLMAEGILIRRNGAKFASPIVETTKRGLNGIAYYSKQLWLLPLVTIIPGTAYQTLRLIYHSLQLGQSSFQSLFSHLLLDSSKWCVKSCRFMCIRKWGIASFLRTNWY